MILDSLCTPIIVAPMAGGPTTPEMVIAAARAGSVGALALGTASASAAREQLATMPDVTYGVNLFCVDGFDEKLDLALAAEHPPAFLWCMFGYAGIERAHAAGLEAWVTVTTPEAAAEAWAAGADLLCVQGPEAGGHRGTFTQEEEPDQRPLEQLVRDIQLADAPLIAAGGIRTAAEVSEALSWPGVRAVSCGSAFLLADEAGTSEMNRGLIRGGGETVSTRAFSGRYARGMATAYTRAHPDIPPSYPEHGESLKHLRSNPDYAYCLVGSRPGLISGGSVAEILGRLSSLGGQVQ